MPIICWSFVATDFVAGGGVAVRLLISCSPALFSLAAEAPTATTTIAEAKKWIASSAVQRVKWEKKTTHKHNNITD